MLGVFDHVVEDLEDIWRDIERSQLKAEGRDIQKVIDRCIELANEAARLQRQLKAASASRVAVAPPAVAPKTNHAPPLRRAA